MAQTQPSQRAHITLAVDHSPSMGVGDVKQVAEAGIKSFISQQKELPGDCTLYVAEFADKLEDAFGPEDITKFQSYTLTPAKTGTPTALFDAIGQSVQQTREWINKLPQEQRPQRVVVAVVTDGVDTGSKEYKGQEGQQKIKKMVSDLESEGWAVQFIGADPRSVEQARSAGIRNVTQTAATAQALTQTFDTMSEAVSQYRGGMSFSAPSRISESGETEWASR